MEPAKESGPVERRATVLQIGNCWALGGATTGGFGVWDIALVPVSNVKCAFPDPNIHKTGWSNSVEVIHWIIISIQSSSC